MGWNEWRQIACYKSGCAGVMALPVQLDDRFRNTKESFFCPMGHSQVYTGEPGPKAEVRVIKEQLDSCRLEGQLAAAQAKREAAARRTAEKRLNAARDGHVFQERGKWKGLCPKCYAEQPRGSKARRGAKAWVRHHDDQEHSPVVPRTTLEAS